MAARAVGLHTPISQYDADNWFRVMRDSHAAEEAMDALFARVEEKVVFPLLERLDDVMINVVSAARTMMADKAGANRENQRWQEYWNRREQRRSEDIERRLSEWERKYGDREGVSGSGDTPAEKPSPGVPMDSSRPIKWDLGTTELSGTTSFDALNRAVAMTSDLIEAEVKADKKEHGARRDMERMRDEFESDPRGYVSGGRPKVDIGDVADRFSDDLDRTLWGDRKIRPEDSGSEDDFSRERHRELAEGLKDPENPYVYQSSGQAAHAIAEAWIQARGFSSAAEMMDWQKREKERIDSIRERWLHSKAEEINAERKAKGLDPVGIDKIRKSVRPPDDEALEKWAGD